MAGKNQIIEAIQRGVKQAQKNYNVASYSLLSWAPEYFMVVNIFQSMFKLAGDNSLTLERNSRDLLKDKPPRGRKIKELRGKGAKLDIILWYSNKGIVRGFIEVKKHSADCGKDIKRVCYMLKNQGQFGVSMSGIYQKYDPKRPLSRQSAEEKLICKLDKLETKFKGLISSHSGADFSIKLLPHEIADIPLKKLDNNEFYIWSPVCFVVEPKK